MKLPISIKMFGVEVTKGEDEIEIRLDKPLTEYKKSDWAGLKEFIRGCDTRVNLRGTVDGVLTDYVTISSRILYRSAEDHLGELDVYVSLRDSGVCFSSTGNYETDSPSKSIDKLFYVDEDSIFNTVRICDITFKVFDESK